MRKRILLIVLVTAAGVALPRLARGDDEATAHDTAGAPLPGDESGRVDGAREHDSTARVVARGVLYVPKKTIEIAFAPVRSGVWFYDRFRISARWRRLFFNDAETVGLYPTASLDSGYGANVGARFVARDVFGEHEHLAAKASTGGRFRQSYLATFRSGERLGERVALELRGELDRRPHEAFYGIGNQSMGLEGRHRQELERATLIADVRTVSALHLRGAGAFTDLSYGPTDDPATSLDAIYDGASLTGFMHGARHLYGELEVRWDSRRRASMWDAAIVPATGGLASVYAGRVHQLKEGKDYWRLGFDLQRYVWLARGPRVLSARAHGEVVTGDYKDVAFTELPQLGGKTLLRGYQLDRFRDHAAVVSTLEYKWDLSRNLMASVFVDAGEVFASETSFYWDALRVGYGFGLEVVTGRNFIAEMSLASSRDGGLFLNLAFDPVYDVDPRVVRR